MKKKIIAIIVALVLSIGCMISVFADSVCDDSLYPKVCQVSIDFPGLIAPRGGPGNGGGGVWPPPPLTY